MFSKKEITNLQEKNVLLENENKRQRNELTSANLNQENMR